MSRNASSGTLRQLKMRMRVGVTLASALLHGTVAHAADPRDEPMSVDDAALQDDGAELDEEPAAPAPWLHLSPPSKFGVGLEGYGGIAVQSRSGEGRAHALVGGLLRLRYHYFQLGGTIELTDSSESTSLGENKIEHWRALGGFAGVMLPFHHWIVVDASVGLSARNYANSDPIYGTTGLSTTLTALTFRFGVSDRLTHKLVGPRLGAALVVAADLASAEPQWKREYTMADGTTAVTTGSTPIGGVSIGLVVSAGFELGARPQ